jgi:hypothetical protein
MKLEWKNKGEPWHIGRKALDSLWMASWKLRFALKNLLEGAKIYFKHRYKFRLAA